MRKNSVRKWLHAILDLLPLFVIPIFAIYTRNENYNSNIEINVPEDKLVTLYNKIENGDFDGTNDWGALYCTLTQTDNNGVVVCNNSTGPFFGIYKGLDNDTYQIGHKYIIRFLFETLLTSGTLYGSCFGTTSLNYINNINGDKWVTAEYVPTQANNQNVTIYLKENQVVGNEFTISNVIFIDTTLTFGEGNEPTIEQFNNYFTDDFYEHGTTDVLIEDYETTTYNDTDVGSQFVYTLYNATDKYFNCTNLFNLEQVWNWVQLNLFGGNAPLMVYVVWQVIVYEFFMDLIFLLYSVFMFVIDFAENCLERPFDKIRRL